MLVGMTVENWRGLPNVELVRLGRVNLVTGRGDVGKTSVLEAVLLSLSPDSFEWIPSLQEWRWGRAADPVDYESTWLPAFRGGDVVRGMKVEGRFDDNTTVAWTLKASVVRRGWSLDWRVDTVEGTVAPSRRGLTTTPPVPPGPVDFWYVPSRSGVIEESLALFTRLDELGLDGDLLDWMRQANPALVSFHREDGRLRAATADAPYPLPLHCFGDGTLRAFEIGCALLTAEPKSVVGIDDIDGGFTDAALARLWKWIERIAAGRDLQVFATTRREACVEAACTAWREAGDSSLRVIRLERRDAEVRADTYDRTLLRLQPIQT